MNKVVSVLRAAAGLQEKWSPRVLADVDDVYVKVAKVRGQLAWHTHENEDEFFMVLKGHLRIELDDGNVERKRLSNPTLSSSEDY
jgi:mannose-6-phosphate isomerase-like protein (cupin superfamily)